MAPCDAQRARIHRGLGDDCPSVRLGGGMGHRQGRRARTRARSSTSSSSTGPAIARSSSSCPSSRRRPASRSTTRSSPTRTPARRRCSTSTRQGDLSIALVDLVWIGEFAENGWIVPIDKFTGDAAITDPNLNLKGFFPLLLDAFGSLGRQGLRAAVRQLFGPALLQQVHAEGCGLRQAAGDLGRAEGRLRAEAHQQGQEPVRLRACSRCAARPSRPTASCAVLWPHGGSLLDKTFHSNLTSKESQAGLGFRQDLMKYMPPGIVSWDHAEAVNGLAQGQVAMITEWSAFYRR